MSDGSHLPHSREQTPPGFPQPDPGPAVANASRPIWLLGYLAPLAFLCVIGVFVEIQSFGLSAYTTFLITALITGAPLAFLTVRTTVYLRALPGDEPRFWPPTTSSLASAGIILIYLNMFVATTVGLTGLLGERFLVLLGAGAN